MSLPDKDVTLVKLLMVGESGVGKSSLLTRFVDDTFNPSFVATIGIDFRIRIVEVGGVRVKLQVWDTAGQERFRSITAAFYRNAMGVVLAYDSTNLSSFSMLPSWLDSIRSRAIPGAILMLVATKCDTDKRVVTTEQGEAFAAEHGLMFVETSAKENTNVDACFTNLASEVLAKFLPATSSDGQAPAPSPIDLKSTALRESVKCCE